MSKQYTALVERVESAWQSGQALNITAGGSKLFYGGLPSGEPFSVLEAQGIVEYDPAELVIVARAGTPLAEIQALLASKGQMLGFEPPFASRGATLGGAVATGLAGAGRPWRGSVRDYLLGAKIINGKGEVVQFGGRVIKNVAGFDLFRPMAGALGTLGVLVEISLRVIPVPEYEASFEFACASQSKIIDEFSRFGMSMPTLSAAGWQQGLARIRLSGSRLAVKHDLAQLEKNYTPAETDPSQWEMVSMFEGPFFTAEKTQHCIASLDLPPATPPIEFPGEQLIDWGGARRYLSTSLRIESVREIVATVGGSATALSGAARSEYFHPLPPGLMKLHTRIKKTFDPRSVFNPGRLFAGL